jgi:protein-S-isoprenylcysteine O-methyltransferase Ste14
MRLPEVRLILLVTWTLWLLRFAVARPTTKAPEKVDPRARWGILLQAVAFLVVYLRASRLPVPGLWRLIPGIALLAAGTALSWAAVRALGRHWRWDAGLDADHQLVRAGPYQLLRHPIYGSILCMLIGSGLLITSWPRLLLGTAVGIAGTEIRVRIEDALLVSRFGDEARAYQRSTPAYIPFLR